MNIQQLCDYYLNYIGIIELDNIKHFLEINSYMINNNTKKESNKSISYIYTIVLFYIYKRNK